MHNPSLLSRAGSAIKSLGFVFTLGLSLAAGNAIADSLSKQEKINTLLDVSGVRTNLEQTETSMLGTLDQTLSQAGVFDISDPNQEAILNRLKRELSVIFTAENITRSVVQYVEDTVPDSHLDKQIAFFKSPTGKTIKALTENSNGTIESPEFQVFMQNFGSSELDEERVFVIKEMIAAYNMHEFFGDIGIDAQIASVMGLTDNLPQSVLDAMYQTQSADDILNTIESMRQPIYQQMYGFVLAYEYYNTRNLDDTTFYSYSDFQLSDEGISMNNAMLAGMRQFSIDAFYVTGAAMGEEISGMVSAAADTE